MSERRWSAGFLAMLESLRMPDQFRQGRRAARLGQVRNLAITSSVVTAMVADEEGELHRIRIAVRSFSQADWRRIEATLAGQAIYAAKLLAGQLPDDLDRVLASFGLSLFPESLDEVGMDCSCPGWQVPCRHLTAAFYTVAESFDTDPFGILAWRGRGREELLEGLRTRRMAPSPEPDAATGRVPASAGSSVGADFWTAGPRLAPTGDAGQRRDDAILDQLDPLGLTAGQYDVTDLLRRAYRQWVRAERPT
jgi:uncharacterized Zn finger protein